MNGLLSYLSFVTIKADYHIMMKHYLHFCPGLIHFIFVDRVRERVLAPRIVSLHTQHNEEQHDVSVEFIKERVWEMCAVTQEYRDKGYLEVGLCSKGVQYWFKEWFEDENGNEIKVIQPVHLKYVRNHYELYTMYLPFVSAQSVAHNNKLLVNMLLEQSKDSKF